MTDGLFWKQSFSLVAGEEELRPYETCPLGLLLATPDGSYNSLWNTISLSFVRHRILSTFMDEDTEVQRGLVACLW